MNNHRAQIRSKVSTLSQQCAEGNLSLKGRAELANTYIVFVIDFCLTAVPYPDYNFTKVEPILFNFS